MSRRKNYSLLIVDPVGERREHLRMLLADFPWLISCCATPLEARAVLSGVSADLVLCGLTAQDLSVLELLEYIQRVNPHCIRMVYGTGGPSSEQLKPATSGFAHQYISYPCEEGRLRDLIIGVLGLHAELSLQSCGSFLKNSSSNLELPSVLRDLEEVLIAPGKQPGAVAAVLQKHPSLASRLLQIVNSAVFFKPASFKGLEQAVDFLGGRLVREIVLFLCAMEVFPPFEGSRYQAIRVAVHSLQCSRLASYIAAQIEPGREDETGAAALLHDLGKLAFLSREDPRYLETSSGLLAFEPASVGLEQELFGVTHGQLGGALLFWWNMPLPAVEAAAKHHLPLTGLEGVARCVAIADRCLLEASQEIMIAELRELPQEYPLEKWRRIAKKLVNTIA